MMRRRKNIVTVEQVLLAPPAHFSAAQLDLIVAAGQVVDTINKAMRTAAEAAQGERGELLRKARATLVLLKAVKREHPFIKLRRLNAVERDLIRLEARARPHLKAGRA
jgi:hypothetical protein